MSIFGIYNDCDDNSYRNLDYEVLSAHFNLWLLPKDINVKSIPGILYNLSLKNYYIDIGLRLKINSSLPFCIDMHLPGTVDTEVTDLKDTVLDEKTNDLLFATKVNSSTRQIFYHRAGEDISDAVCEVISIEPVNHTGLERYRIRINPENYIQSLTDTIYVRFRYKCEDPKRLFTYKGWGFAKRGYIVDLRVNDLRETIEYDEMNQSTHMKEIKEFNGFLILPVNYVCVHGSPAFHYSRLLEANAWKYYLKYTLPYNKRSKLVIHQWKKNQISYLKPFRAYGHFHKEFGVEVLTIYAFGIIIPAIVSLLFQLF